MSTSDKSRILGTIEAGALIGISGRSIRKAIEVGNLPGFQQGARGKWFVLEDDVWEYAEKYHRPRRRPAETGSTPPPADDLAAPVDDAPDFARMEMELAGAERRASELEIERLRGQVEIERLTAERDLALQRSAHLESEVRRLRAMIRESVPADL